MKRIAIAFALLAVLSGAEQLTAQTLRYRLIDLGTLGGPNSAENVQSPILNKEGVVVGFSDTSIPCPIPACFFFHAFRWQQGILRDLGTLAGGDNSVAFGINALTQTIGQSENGLINPLAGVPENDAVLGERMARSLILERLEEMAAQHSQSIVEAR